MNKSKMTFNKICKGVGQFFYKYRFLWMRIGVALFTLMLAMFLCFLILELMPADSIDQMAIKLAAERRIPFEEARELAIEILGYNPDESIWNKLGSYVSNLFEGNLGTSIVNPSINVNSVIKKNFALDAFCGNSFVDYQLWFRYFARRIHGMEARQSRRRVDDKLYRCFKRDTGLHFRSFGAVCVCLSLGVVSADGRIQHRVHTRI